MPQIPVHAVISCARSSRWQARRRLRRNRWPAPALRPWSRVPPRQRTRRKLQVGYACFSADEAAFVESMVNVMCPADQYTPNGVDCGLAIFIDRQLAGAYGQGAGRYMSGPWAPSKPQMGLQLPLTPAQFFSAGVAAANRQCQAQLGKTFDQLAPAEADAFLKDLSHGKIKDDELALVPWFNELMYPLFEQACFADPLYGGNHDKVFWKMVGYPGLPATHTLDMLDFRGKPYPGAQDPKSIIDFS